MKLLRIFLAFILFLIFFVWPFEGAFYKAFLVESPRFYMMLFFIFSLIVFTKKPEELIAKVYPFLYKYRFFIFPFAGFIFSLSVNIYIFHRLPHVQDEFHYKLMAETFASGKISWKLPEHYEFLEYIFLVPDKTRYFSLFMPGFSLFLTPFTFLGIDFLVNPLLTALNIFLLGRFADYFLKKEISLLTMFFYSFSPFVFMNGGSFLGHTFCAALTLIALYSFVASLRTKSLYLPIITGFSLGWLMMTRAQNMLFTSIVLGITLLINIKKDKIILQSFSALAGLLPWIAALLFYNNYFSGSPLFFIQDLYLNPQEPRDFCHYFALGKGCIHINGIDLPFSGLTLAYAFEMQSLRLLELAKTLFVNPFFLLFAAITFLNYSDFAEYRKKLFLLALFISSFTGYFFFYYHANVHGPRYFFEVTPFLVILISLGIQESLDFIDKNEYKISKKVVFAFFAAAPIYYAGVTLPETIAFYHKGFWGVGENLKDEIELRDIHNSVIFVFPYNRETLGSGFITMNLADPEKSDNIIVKDLGDESNARYMHFMKGRKFYRSEYLPHKFDEIELKEITPVLPETILKVEMEDKFPPFADRINPPDYCNTIPLHKTQQLFVHFPKFESIQFSRWALFCRYTKESEEYNFGQYFQENGKYLLQIRAVTGNVMGKFDIMIDNKKAGSFDFYSSKDYSAEEFTASAQISKGFKYITIKPSSESLSKNKKNGNYSYFVLDWIRFSKEENQIETTAK